MGSGPSISSSPRMAAKPRCSWSSRPAPNCRSPPRSGVRISSRSSANATISSRATRSGSNPIRAWRTCSMHQAGNVSLPDREESIMTMFTRRTLVQSTLAATGALAGSGLLEWAKAWAQAAPWKPEKGAQLSLLRWKYFVQSEDDTFMALLDAFTKATGVKVTVARESFEDIPPKASVAANTNAGPDLFWGLCSLPHLFPQKCLDVTDVADYLGKKYGGWVPSAVTYGKSGSKWIDIPVCFNDKVILNSPETVKALEYAKQLYDNMIPGVAAWNDAFNNKAFLAGEISWTNNGISIYAAAKRDPSKKEIVEDMDHALWPVGPVGKPTEFHVCFPMLAMTYTKYPQACKALLAYLLEADQYNKWLEASVGYLTHPLNAYDNNPVWTSDTKNTI